MRFIPFTHRLMSLVEYKNQLEALKKYRGSIGLPESLSLELLIDEAKLLVEGEK